MSTPISVSIPTERGHALAGFLDTAQDDAPRGFALFAHCFTCSKESLAARRISQALSAQGIHVLRVDFTGAGLTPSGDLDDASGFSSHVEDLVDAAAWLREHHQGPALLVGHSLGGAAVLAAADRIPDVKAVATLNAPSDPSHIRHLFVDDEAAIREKGRAAVTIGGREFCVDASFLDDIQSTKLLPSLGRGKRALLVMHSPVDNVVSVEHARSIFEAANHPKSFVSLDHADHLLTGREDAQYAASVLAAWATRYLEVKPSRGTTETEADVLVAEHPAGKGEEVSKFLQDVFIGRHRLLADEPPSVGGDDAGPSPYQFLLAGLGACTSMTLRMYADRKGWPLDDVRVHLSHGKIHAKDCETCETTSGKVDQIVRHIELVGDLDEEQTARILEIADRCPVHRTLHGEVVVKSTGGLVAG